MHISVLSSRSALPLHAARAIKKEDGMASASFLVTFCYMSVAFVSGIAIGSIMWMPRHHEVVALAIVPFAAVLILASLWYG